MTINIADNNPRVSYSVSAGVTQTSFAVPFEFFDETDVLVYIDSTLKTITTDYTVSGGDGTTGTITMSVTGPATVALVRDVTIERSTDFPTAGPFSIQSLNVELDKQIAIDADLEDQIDRAVRSPIEEFTTMTLPDAATRADRVLKFDASGNVAVETSAAFLNSAIVGANFVNDTFTGTGSQTVFTLSSAPGSKNNCQIFIDGVYQEKASFSISGTTLTFTEAPPNNSSIEAQVGNAVDSFSSTAIAVTTDDTGNYYTATNVESTFQEIGGVIFAKTTAGTGITAGVGTVYKAGSSRSGDIIITRIFIDLTGLNSGGTAADIIGLNSTSNPCHIGQITAATSGTIFWGKMTCIETPAGGDTDIDLYAADEGTGVEDAAISGLTETQIVNGGTHSAGSEDLFAASPAANQYLYLVGQGTADATYTAGQFLIELYGYA